jgi:hypothetical protein
MRTLFKSVVAAAIIITAASDAWADDQSDCIGVHGTPADAGASPLLTLESRRDLVAQLGAMAATDQWIRQHQIQAVENGADEDELSEIMSLWEQIDSENERELRAILDTHSWCDLSTLGRTAIGFIWTIIQHSRDPEFQRVQLDEMEPLLRRQLIHPSQYALLLDRITFRLDGHQVYGTQLTCSGGELVPVPILDPETVDDRRAELMMPPLRDYIQVTAETNRTACEATD